MVTPFLTYQKSNKMFKKEIRKKYKDLRAAITTDLLEDKAIEIANNLLKLPVWEYTNYHVFLPIEKLKEINTEYIIQILSGKDKNIIISKSDFESGEMTHFLLNDSTKLVLNSYGIPEPVNGIKISEIDIEVIFIPLLAFDKQGNRVGYGKGFYDKFLSKCSSKTIKIGLSFFEAENQIEDVYEGDIKLDYCITPEKTYTFIKK